MSQQQLKDGQSNWPVSFDAFEWPKQIAAPIAALCILLLVLLVLIGIFAIGWLMVDLVSGDQKRAADASKAALPILAAAVGLPLLI